MSTGSSGEATTHRISWVDAEWDALQRGAEAAWLALGGQTVHRDAGASSAAASTVMPQAPDPTPLQASIEAILDPFAEGPGYADAASAVASL